MENKNQNKSKNQNMILENREKLSASGVSDVNSFTNEIVIAETELGLLTIKGHDLKISKLNLDNGEMIVEGFVCSCIYSEIQPKGVKGILNRMFK